MTWIDSNKFTALWMSSKENSNKLYWINCSSLHLIFVCHTKSIPLKWKNDQINWHRMLSIWRHIITNPKMGNVYWNPFFFSPLAFVSKILFVNSWIDICNICYMVFFLSLHKISSSEFKSNKNAEESCSFSFGTQDVFLSCENKRINIATTGKRSKNMNVERRPLWPTSN